MLLVLIIFTHYTLLSAQTLEEWVEQDRTKIKRLAEQIAANKVYIEYLQNGIKVVSSGLFSIGNTRKDDHQLHLLYIDSLSIINPAIRIGIKINDITALQLLIVKIAKQVLQRVERSGQFSDAELKYCKTVFDKLLDECATQIDEVILLVDPPTHMGRLYRMTDDERMESITRLFNDLRDQYAFASSFSNDMKLLAIQRLSERIEIEYSKIR